MIFLFGINNLFYRVSHSWKLDDMGAPTRLLWKRKKTRREQFQIALSHRLINAIGSCAVGRVFCYHQPKAMSSHFEYEQKTERLQRRRNQSTTRRIQYDNFDVQMNNKNNRGLTLHFPKTKRNGNDSTQSGQVNEICRQIAFCWLTCVRRWYTHGRAFAPSSIDTLLFPWKRSRSERAQMNSLPETEKKNNAKKKNYNV